MRFAPYKLTNPPRKVAGVAAEPGRGVFRRKALASADGRHAFTFLEVLFSVIIIGVGFIMVAAMFPVAIQQTQVNLAESEAVSVGRDAIRDIQSAVSNYVPTTTYPAGVPNPLILPPTYNQTGIATLPVTAFPVMPLPNAPITLSVSVSGNTYVNTYAQSTAVPAVSIAGAYNGEALVNNLANSAILAATANQVYGADRRFGWVGFYRRDWVNVNVNGATIPEPSPTAQIWIITAQCATEGQPTFSPTFSTNSTANVQAYNISTNAAVNTPVMNYNGFPNPLVTQNNFSPAILTYNTQTPASPNSPVGNSIYLPNLGPSYAAPMAGTGTFALVVNAADTNLIGQVLRLGSVVSSTSGNYLPSTTNGTYWLLQPGNDLNPNDAVVRGAPQNVTVFVLGSPLFVQGTGLGASASYNGAIQDISCTTGFIRCNN